MWHWRKDDEAPMGRVTLPSGEVVHLDRPFHTFSASELASLGIYPSLGGNTEIVEISAGGRSSRIVRVLTNHARICKSRYVGHRDQRDGRRDDSGRTSSD